MGAYAVRQVRYRNRREPCVKVANEAITDAGISAGDVDEIVLGLSTPLFAAGFHGLAGACRPIRRCASSRHPGRERLRTGSAAVHQGIRAIDVGAAKFVLVVGVEQMTRTPSAEIGKNLLKASTAGGRRGGRRFAGVFGKIAQAYFQKYGDQSDALAMIAAKNHKNGVANPYAQMRKDSASTSAAPRARRIPMSQAPEADRLLAGVRRRGRSGADGFGDREKHEQGGQRPCHGARAGFLPMSKRDILQFEAARSPGSARCRRPVCSSPICRSSKPMTASRSPN